MATKANNVLLRRVKKRLASAIVENSKGKSYLHLLPTKQDVLGLRYADQPHVMNGTIAGHLARLNCLHLAQVNGIMRGTEPTRTTKPTNDNFIENGLRDLRECIENINSRLDSEVVSVEEVQQVADGFNSKEKTLNKLITVNHETATKNHTQLKKLVQDKLKIFQVFTDVLDEHTEMLKSMGSSETVAPKRKAPDDPRAGF